MTTFSALDDAALLVGTGVQARTLRTAREQGLLRCVLLGREWRTMAEEVERYKGRLWEVASSGPVPTQGAGTSPHPPARSPRRREATQAAGSNASEQLGAALANELKRRKPIGR